ncbi:hypothetical protein CASFOL_015574 [Castilleja foliolosa]|uniref:KIB1-4 beta-propeller domain-containing protein n=1 Tax=Castilleja foliolosa TaxID=1961234 RepID=A0ABD3DG59_9LAMI
MSSMAQTIFSSSPSFITLSPIVPTIFSSSPIRFIRLIPNVGRMTTVSCLKNPSPCLLLPPTFDGGSSDDMVYNMYNLAQNKVLKFNNKKLIPEDDTRIVGSSHGWLSLFDERNHDLILTNPVTGSHVKLPPSNSNISCYSKVILSSDAEQEDCQAMMINSRSRLAFCCPGRSPTEWTPLGALMCPPPLSHIPRCYADLVYSRRHNLFFCVTNAYEGDDFEAWDVASDPPRLRWENRGDLMDHYNRWLTRAEMLLMAETGLWCSHCTYLVFAEQMDQLFFVTRHVVIQMAPDGSVVEDVDNDIYPYKTILFDVHKLDWEFGGDGGRLTHLDGGSLDGLAMFVGLNH